MDGLFEPVQPEPPVDVGGGTAAAPVVDASEPVPRPVPALVVVVGVAVVVGVTALGVVVGATASGAEVGGADPGGEDGVA